MKRFLYRNRNGVLSLAILMLLGGAYTGYIYYGTEPNETIGGFICGLGFGVLLIYFSNRD